MGGYDLNDEPALLTTQEVAKMFLVTERTVRKWVAMGFLHPIRTPGNHYRYMAKEVTKIWHANFSKQT